MNYYTQARVSIYYGDLGCKHAPTEPCERVEFPGACAEINARAFMAMLERQHPGFVSFALEVWCHDCGALHDAEQEHRECQTCGTCLRAAHSDPDADVCDECAGEPDPWERGKPEGYSA